MKLRLVVFCVLSICSVSSGDTAFECAESFYGQHRWSDAEPLFLSCVSPVSNSEPAADVHVKAGVCRVKTREFRGVRALFSRVIDACMVKLAPEASARAFDQLHRLLVKQNRSAARESLAAQHASAESEFQRRFEAHYVSWKRHCASSRVACSSLIAARIQSDHFKAIVDMGPEVLPLVAEKCMHDTNFHWMGWAWVAVSKIQPDPTVNPWAKDSVKTWWEGGLQLAHARSLLLLRRMRKADEEGRRSVADKTRRGLCSLGIFALPTLFAEVENGKDDVVPLIRSIVDPTVRTAEKETLLAWWKANGERYGIPKGPNTKP